MATVRVTDDWCDLAPETCSTLTRQLGGWHCVSARSMESEMQSVEVRQAIFLALVQTQDEGTPVRTSRATMAARFAVSVEDVETIEREGLMRKWPPLA
jgi:hypothetical protein